MIEHNGKRYARVSDIIKPFGKYYHINPLVLANKCKIGTLVHEAIADDLEGNFPCLKPDAMGYFNSFLQWKEALSPTFTQSECRYFCDEKMISGQIDCLINLPTGPKLPTLVDFKTSAQESKETWPMQAHLYGYLLYTNGIAVCPRFLFVKLSKNGSLPEVFEYLYDPNTNAKCLSAIDDYWKRHKVADSY